jgi:hypothetical protein
MIERTSPAGSKKGLALQKTPSASVQLLSPCNLRKSGLAVLGSAPQSEQNDDHRSEHDEDESEDDYFEERVNKQSTTNDGQQKQEAPSVFAKAKRQRAEMTDSANQKYKLSLESRLLSHEQSQKDVRADELGENSASKLQKKSHNSKDRSFNM